MRDIKSELIKAHSLKQRSVVGGGQPTLPFHHRAFQPKPIHIVDTTNTGLPTYIVPGVSMSILARGTGLTLGGISRIFNGGRQPRLANLRAIAAYLKLSVDDVLKLIDDRKAKRAA